MWFSIAMSNRTESTQQRIDYETDLVAVVIYIHAFEFIFSRQFRVWAVRRTLRAANKKKNNML